MKQAVRKFIVLGLSLAGALAASAAPEVTNAQQTLDLGLARARPGDVPVRLHGTVTYQAVLSPRWVFVQDESAGVLVIMDSLPFPIATGQIVDVTGMATAGWREPYVHATTFKWVGTGPLPVARPATPAHLEAGFDFGQWSKITGTVRDVAITKGRLVLVCASAGKDFQVWITARDLMQLPLDLLDARVSLDGIPWSGLEEDGRSHSFLFDLPGTNFITVLRPGSSNVFHGANIPIAQIGAATAGADDRLRTSGVVTFVSADGWLAAQDDDRSVIAHLYRGMHHDEDPKAQYVQREETQPQSGDMVDMVGARSGGADAPELTDVEYRILGRSLAPTAIPISSAGLEDERNDGRLVTIKGQTMNVQTRFKAHMIDSEHGHEYDIFESRAWLNVEGRIVDAVLESRDREALPVEVGKYVSVTGVCLMEPGPERKALSVQVYLRGPTDVAAASAPAWWASRQILTAAGFGCGIAGLASLWIMLLRRRVADRTAALRAEVAERERAEARLARFVSMVSHEIRNPLANILSSAEMLQRYPDRLVSEERMEQLGIIREAVDRMTFLLEDVLVFNCAQAGRLAFHVEPFLVEPFCRLQIQEVLASSHSRNPIELQVAKVTAPAAADKALLRHILSNLLNNAVKYSAAGQAVTVELEREDDDLVVRVRDHGIGIPAEDRKELFTPFFRGRNAASHRGTGLGLVIVRHCVERHGGNIHIDSLENAGTTVTVRLPVFCMTPEPAQVQALA